MARGPGGHSVTGATEVAGHLAGLGASVAIYWVSPVRFRSLVIAAASLLFVASVSLRNASFLVANVWLVFWVSRWMSRDREASWRGLALASVVTWLLGSLAFFKYAPAIFPDHVDTIHLLLPLGYSYYAFRLVHYVVEVKRGQITDVRGLDLLSYVSFFPTFVAGPIERYPVFNRQLKATTSLSSADLSAGVGRIISGAFKKLVVADALAPYVFSTLGSPEGATSVGLACAMYGLAFYLYMDFSGYSDMAIGAGRLFGLRIVENFDRPFLRANIADFWRHWHMSLYAFVRDYFFLPLFRRRITTAWLSFGMFLTLMLLMVWHDASWSFVLLGVYHGVGMATWFWFQGFKKRRPALRAFFARPLTHAACVVVTFHFFCLTLPLFFLDVPGEVLVLRRLFGLS